MMKMSEYHFGTLLINTLNMFWIWSKCNLYSSNTPAQRYFRHQNELVKNLRCHSELVKRTNLVNTKYETTIHKCWHMKLTQTKRRTKTEETEKTNCWWLLFTFIINFLEMLSMANVSRDKNKFKAWFEKAEPGIRFYHRRNVRLSTQVSVKSVFFSWKYQKQW